jgi:hypothetical protein
MNIAASSLSGLRSAPTLNSIGKDNGFHELDTDDSLSMNQFSKVDRHEDYILYINNNPLPLPPQV